MPVMTEPVHTGEFIVSEGNNSISRELVELSPDLILLPGTVLGKNTATSVYGPLDPAADTGMQMAAGVVWDHVSTDATGGEAVIIARLAEVHQDLLVWPDGITEEQQTTAIEELASLDIILRQGESA
ncbi:head decoration protein [Endozoicomonas atrinae]|uniref:head decoration protein n=1 Tax=Endozoicomonas atrinae TaxID=1333660 RepID=UPI000826077C|nr:head decoration protein [Endozoicomonas atrinae]